MKKIVYLAPALLLGLVGKGAMADQNTHISHFDEGLMTSLSEPQPDQAVNANKSQQEQVAQNKDVKANETNEIKKATTHISSLDSNDVIYNTLNVSSRTKFATYTNFAESKQVAANDDSEKYSVVNDINDHNYSVNNPNQNKVIIHYVDENGKSISGLKDYTIDLTKRPQGTTKGQFNVPDNRYVLPDPNKQYDITNLRKTIHHNAITHVVHHPEETHVVHHEATGHNEATGTQWIVTGSDGDTDVFDDDMNNHTPGDSMWGTGSGNPGDTVVSATPSTTYTWVEDTPAWDETVVDRNAWDETVTDRPAYNETKGPTTFAEDNTLNIKSIVGNTVNVILKHGTKNVDANNSDIELDSWRKLHAINSNNQNNLTNKSVKFKVGYTLDLVSSVKVADLASYKAVSNPNDFISENNLTNPVGFSTINNKLLSISL